MCVQKNPHTEIMEGWWGRPTQWSNERGGDPHTEIMGGGRPTHWSNRRTEHRGDPQITLHFPIFIAFAGCFLFFFLRKERGKPQIPICVDVTWLHQHKLPQVSTPRHTSWHPLKFCKAFNLSKLWARNNSLLLSRTSEKRRAQHPLTAESRTH